MNKKLNEIMNMVTSEDLMTMVNEVNAWDNSLDYLQFLNMEEEFDEYMYNIAPTDLANMIHYGDFNPNDTYFHFNVYGNLISYSTYEMLEELDTWKEEIVERFIELYEEYKVDLYNNKETKARIDEILGMEK